MVKIHFLDEKNMSENPKRSILDSYIELNSRKSCKEAGNSLDEENYTAT